MKTLDEVIFEAPYSPTPWEADALHYLKEYRMQLDDIVAKRKVLEYKTAQYEQMCETVQKQGQEHEDRLQAEIARYVEAVKSCEEAENKYKALQIGFIRATADLEDNPPLDWEQLKTMEGKPVWVESHGNITEFTGWAIVRNALEDRAHFIFSHYDGEFLTYEMALPDVTFGKEWKAYRKERHER